MSVYNVHYSVSNVMCMYFVSVLSKVATLFTIASIYKLFWDLRRQSLVHCSSMMSVILVTLWGINEKLRIYLHTSFVIFPGSSHKRHSFGSVLEYSICKCQQTHAWCDNCGKYMATVSTYMYMYLYICSICTSDLYAVRIFLVFANVSTWYYLYNVSPDNVNCKAMFEIRTMFVNQDRK